MKNMRLGILATIGLMFLNTAATSGQTNPTITSLDRSGLLVFGEVTNATLYRVEWSTNLASASWYTSAPPGVAGIPHVGSGSRIVTVGVGQAASCYRVVATMPSSTNSTPAVMALIPAGSFTMGNATNVFLASEGFEESPQHAVNVDAFYMDIYEVTKAHWDEVKAYNGGNGYTYSNAGGGKATNHPVHTVNWYDAVKWCNARSQREGLTPVYYTDAGFTTVYKTGELNISNEWVNWSANGYRLPTEAEWEKAARGGAANTRFPWTDYTNKISWDKANYFGENNLRSYDLSGGSGAWHPTFANPPSPYSSPVGYFAPNDFGIYDVAGNVLEWCWDWYSDSYYATSPVNNPRGPVWGTSRVLRGGSWSTSSSKARCASRGPRNPDIEDNTIGFRCVRRL